MGDVVAIAKKYWYVIAGGLVLLFVLMRRGATAPARALPIIPRGELTQATPEGTMGDTVSAIARQLEESFGQTQLSEQRLAQQDIAARSSLLQGETDYLRKVQDLLLGKASGTLTKAQNKLLKCPSGTFHIDPTTGQAYCRQEQSHGFIGDVVKPALGSALSAYATYQLGGVPIPTSTRSRPGTPPRAATPGIVMIPHNTR